MGGPRFSLLGGTLALALCAALALLPGLALAATDTYVDHDSGGDTIDIPDPDNPGGTITVVNDCTDPARPCATIQVAVDAVDAGGTTHVGGGTYTQTVNLGGGKSLVEDDFQAGLVDPSQTEGDAILDGSGGCPADPTIAVAAADPAGTIQGLTVRSGCTNVSLAATATLLGNTFDDAAKTDPAAPDVEVLDGAGSPTLTGNTFVDSETSDSQTALAIHATSSPTVGGEGSGEANDFTGFGTAILVDGAGATPLIDSNTILGVHNSTLPAPAGGLGISATGGAVPAITGNSITGATAQTTGISIQATPPVAETEVSGNTLESLDTGIRVDGALAAVDANTFNEIAVTGIDVLNYANPTVTANRLTNVAAGTSVGIAISEVAPPAAGTGTGATLQRNHVIGMATGVSVANTTGPVTLFDEVIAGSNVAGLALADDPADGDAEGGNVTVRNSTIAQRTAGIDITVADAAITIDSSIVGDNNTGGIDASGGATCQIDYSRGPVAPTAPQANGCDAFGTATPPDFADAALHLDATSPANLGSLIDAGNPDNFAEDTVGDFDDPPDPRQVDGNGDCKAVRDIGADEALLAGPPATCVLNSTSIRRDLRGLRATFTTAGPIGGNYRLCVKGPKLKRQSDTRCRALTARKAGGQFVSKVSWGAAFRTQGPGTYRVSWLKPGTTREIGPSRSFVWSTPCPPREQTMDGIWKPHRLQLLSRCKSFTATVSTSNYYSANDNDIHFRVSRGNLVTELLDRDAGHLRNTAKHDRGNGPHDPHRGNRIRWTGVYVCDTFHGPRGHYELHGVFKMVYLNGPRATRISGPQFPGTPRVKLSPAGRFHC
jgi:hypothetical protein